MTALPWGLLWYDDNPGLDLGEKLRPAVRRYVGKFDRQPDTCYVHPSTMNGKRAITVGDVTVRAGKATLRHHFLICDESDHRRKQ